MGRDFLLIYTHNTVTHKTCFVFLPLKPLPRWRKLNWPFWNWDVKAHMRAHVMTRAKPGPYWRRDVICLKRVLQSRTCPWISKFLNFKIKDKNEYCNISYHWRVRQLLHPVLEISNLDYKYTTQQHFWRTTTLNYSFLPEPWHSFWRQKGACPPSWSRISDFLAMKTELWLLATKTELWLLLLIIII